MPTLLPVFRQRKREDRRREDRTTDPLVGHEFGDGDKRQPVQMGIDRIGKHGGAFQRRVKA